MHTSEIMTSKLSLKDFVVGHVICMGLKMIDFILFLFDEITSDSSPYSCWMLMPIAGCFIDLQDRSCHDVHNRSE
jgi:hypothetical protein